MPTEDVEARCPVPWKVSVKKVMNLHSQCMNSGSLFTTTITTTTIIIITTIILGYVVSNFVRQEAQCSSAPLAILWARQWTNSPASSTCKGLNDGLEPFQKDIYYYVITIIIYIGWQGPSLNINIKIPPFSLQKTMDRHST